MLDTTPEQFRMNRCIVLLDTFFDHLGRKTEDKDAPNKELKDSYNASISHINFPSFSKISQSFNPDATLFLWLFE